MVQLMKVSGGIRGGCLLLAASVGLISAPAEARRVPSPSRSEPGQVFTPATSLEGNFLAAYIAGASRDTSAAAVFYREALKEDPKNPELLERSFLALLADGDVPAAAQAAERVTSRNAGNGIAQLTLAARALKAKQYVGARKFL